MDDEWQEYIAKHTPQVGDTFRVFYREGNPNNKVFHVRAIVAEEYVVIRWWSYRKKNWIYKLEWVGYFDSEFVKLIKRKK